MNKKERAALLRKYKTDEKLYILWTRLFNIDSQTLPESIVTIADISYPRYNLATEKKRKNIANKISAHITKHYSVLFTK